MRTRSHAMLLVGAMLATAPTFASNPTDEGDVTAHIRALEARIAELEARQNQNDWLTEARAGEIRSLVQDVLADADTRASLLQGAGSAGFDNGFFMSSADGNFRLNVLGLIQFRYVFNRIDDTPGFDSTRSGFELKRTRLVFSGHVIDPSIIYKIQGTFGPSGGVFGLEDAYIGKAFGNGWTVLAGQMKVPLVREFLVADRLGQLVERSLISEEFGAGRTQGVAIDYRNDQFHFTGGFTDGHSATGGFNMPALALDTEYSFTGRAEVLFAGSWNQFNDLPSWQGEDFGFLLGAGAHFQDGEYGTASSEAKVFQWTVDATAEFGGANLMAWFVGRHIDFNGGGELDQYGFVLQGGFFVTDDWEIFGRFEWGDDDLSSDDLMNITIGATKFFAQHRLKWTTDIGYGIESVSSTFGSGLLGPGGGGAGWRTDPAGEDGQIVIRSQFQLVF